MKVNGWVLLISNGLEKKIESGCIVLCKPVITFLVLQCQIFDGNLVHFLHSTEDEMELLWKKYYKKLL